MDDLSVTCVDRNMIGTSVVTLQVIYDNVSQRPVPNGLPHGTLGLNGVRLCGTKVLPDGSSKRPDRKQSTPPFDSPHHT